MDAKVRLQTLHEHWHGCTRCALHQMRSGADIYFGVGKSAPKYLFVSGTPTEADEFFGSLVAGDEGAILFELMERAGIDQKECYFTYAVCCRPKVFIPATDTEPERIEGRAPGKEELIACRPRLYEQLYLTDPRIIITVGETATKAIVRGRLPKFLTAVGKQYVSTLLAATKEDHEDGKVMGKSRYHDLVYPVFAIPEMQTIINNPSMAEHGPYAVALRTLTRAREYTDFVLEHEISTMKGNQ